QVESNSAKNLNSDQDSLPNLIIYATPQGRTVHLRKAQNPNASDSQLADLPYQQSTPLDPSSSKQDQEVQDLCHEILMVRISEEPEGDPTERLNLDDYNSEDFDEYLSNNMETTPPTIIEAQATTKENLPAPPPPAVTVTVQLDEQYPAEDLYEHRHQLNQKRAFRHQRLVNTLQEQQGDNYDYSNYDLRSVINVGRDARNIIISRRKEREEVEAYSPSSNYRIRQKASASFKKHKPATISTRPQGKPRTPHQGESSQSGNRINKVLLRKCFIQPKSSHTIFQCDSLRKALGAPLLKETLPINLVDLCID